MGELAKFFVFNNGTESFGNSSVFASSLLLFTLIQNHSLLSEIAMGNGCLPSVNTMVTLLYCVYLMQRLHHIRLDMCKYLLMQN
jgi:hypothetical protein